MKFVKVSKKKKKEVNVKVAKDILEGILGPLDHRHSLRSYHSRQHCIQMQTATAR